MSHSCWSSHHENRWLSGSSYADPGKGMRIQYTVFSIIYNIMHISIELHCQCRSLSGVRSTRAGTILATKNTHEQAWEQPRWSKARHPTEKKWTKNWGKKVRPARSVNPFALSPQQSVQANPKEIRKRRMTKIARIRMTMTKNGDSDD